MSQDSCGGFYLTGQLNQFKKYLFITELWCGLVIGVLFGNENLDSDFNHKKMKYMSIEIVVLYYPVMVGSLV